MRSLSKWRAITQPHLTAIEVHRDSFDIVSDLLRASPDPTLRDAVTLVNSDTLKFLSENSGLKFDVVFEDAFTDKGKPFAHASFSGTWGRKCDTAVYNVPFLKQMYNCITRGGLCITHCHANVYTKDMMPNLSAAGFLVPGVDVLGSRRSVTAAKMKQDKDVQGDEYTLIRVWRKA